MSLSIAECEKLHLHERPFEGLETVFINPCTLLPLIAALLHFLDKHISLFFKGIVNICDFS